MPLFAFLFLIGLTGLLLGWKKHADLVPPTQTGAGTHTAAWISLDSLRHIAEAYAVNELKADSEIDRIDIRPAKGAAKIVYARHFTEVQIDVTTGEILSVRPRYSDLLEKIHDGSILDYFIGTSDDPIKVVYTTLVSTGLMTLSVTGFYLWYNPRRIRQRKKEGGRAGAGVTGGGEEGRTRG